MASSTDGGSSGAGAGGAGEVTPEMVLQHTRPTDSFLCPLSANVYGIEFLQFAIIDFETKKTIFEVGRDCPPPPDMSFDFSASGEDAMRKIQYTFSEDVLRLPYIQTSLVFSCGNIEVPEFRMIEMHYFRDRLVKSFDFRFGFCIPSSTNTWDAVYSVPSLSDELIEDMIEHPFETTSDSFYFVDGKLIMHNKAGYRYLREQGGAQAKSYENKYRSRAAKADTPTRSRDGSDDEDGKAAAKGDDDDDAHNGDERSAAEKAQDKSQAGGAAKEDEFDGWSKEEDYADDLY